MSVRHDFSCSFGIVIYVRARSRSLKICSFWFVFIKGVCLSEKSSMFVFYKITAFIFVRDRYVRMKTIEKRNERMNSCGVDVFAWSGSFCKIEHSEQSCTAGLAVLAIHLTHKFRHSKRNCIAG